MQGGSLYPLLYLLCDEAMITESTDNMETGISVGGRIINTIRYTDARADERHGKPPPVTRSY